MNKNQNRIVFWVIWMGLIVFYFFIQFKSAQWTQYLYAHQSFGLLNWLTRSESIRPLEFYLGRMNEVAFGPLSITLSGLALLLLCRRYFLKASGLHFGLVIFVYLLITKFEVLFFPSYGESGSGPLAEAIWLYRHHFDYIGLAYQNNYSMGGPKVYLTSIYPSFVALLLTLAPTVKSFFVTYHVLMFASAAGIVALFRSMALKIFDEERALLLALLLLALPLFQSMMEVVNMEMLCLFFAVVSAYAIINKRVGVAIVAAIFASLVKGPGGIACATVFIASLGLFFFDPEIRKRGRILFWAMIAVIFGLSKLYLLKTFINPVSFPAGNINWFLGIRPLLGSRFLCLFLIVSLAGVTWTFFREKKVFKEDGLRGFFRRHFVLLVNICFVLMWFGMYMNVSVMGPRYKLLLAPFLLLSVAYAVLSVIPSRRMQKGVLVTAILLAFFGSFGLFHPDKLRSYTYAYNELERSLEYRNDLKLDQLLVKTLKNEFPGFTVAAPFVVAQNLAMPELGYVRDPLDVILYGFSVDYGGIKNFSGLSSMNIAKTIWVGFKNDRLKINVPYPIDPQLDRIIKELVVGDKEITLFQGGFAVDRMALIYQYFYKNITAARGQ